MAKEPSNIVLVGFMGVGKSTIGKMLSSETGLPFLDTDRVIERKERASVSEIFELRGEAYFRKKECEAIEEICRDPGGHIIATGGGVLLNPENERRLRERGVLIGLTAAPEEIQKRVGNGNERPLLKGKKGLEDVRRLLHSRAEIYRKADITIETDGKTPRAVLEELRSKVKPELLPLRVQIQVSLGHGKGYPIIVGSGNLPEIGAHLAQTFRNKIAVVTNPLVWRLHGSTLKNSLVRAGFKPLIIMIPDGERYKTVNWVQQIIGQLLKNRFERSSPILAFGGGVIGDLAGFASGIYLRGTPVIQVPTTLIAQVDSSIGGKTGVNDKLGKNLIGVFHQPRIVWIDTTLLNSLKERDYLSGLAEVIKYGMIADPKLFNFMRRERERIIGRERGAVRELITRSCQIKSRIVSRDEREAGLRKVLNYGHTLGHAIEAVTGYRKYRHGEAISIGMHFAASLAFRLGECERSVVDSQKAMIESFRLPATPPKVKGADLLKSMELDKKVEEGKIYFILPLRIGRVVIKPVERGLIKEVIHSMV